MNQLNSKYPLDANGKPFSKHGFWLVPKEYAKIIAEINSLYKAQYEGETICSHTSFGIDGNVYVYWFENHGFDNYNIYLRVADNHR